jgi:hypothetical protein
MRDVEAATFKGGGHAVTGVEVYLDNQGTAINPYKRVVKW